MSVKIVSSESWRRKVEKGVSRDLDDHLLSNGHQSYADMAISNDFFAALNLNGFAISAIGGRRIARDDG